MKCTLAAFSGLRGIKQLVSACRQILGASPGFGRCISPFDAPRKAAIDLAVGLKYSSQLHQRVGQLRFVELGCEDTPLQKVSGAFDLLQSSRLGSETDNVRLEGCFRKREVARLNCLAECLGTVGKTRGCHFGVPGGVK